MPRTRDVWSPWPSPTQREMRGKGVVTWGVRAYGELDTSSAVRVSSVSVPKGRIDYPRPHGVTEDVLLPFGVVVGKRTWEVASGRTSFNFWFSFSKFGTSTPCRWHILNLPGRAPCQTVRPMLHVNSKIPSKYIYTYELHLITCLL